MYTYLVSLKKKTRDFYTQCIVQSQRDQRQTFQTWMNLGTAVP